MAKSDFSGGNVSSSVTSTLVKEPWKSLQFVFFLFRIMNMVISLTTFLLFRRRLAFCSQKILIPDAGNGFISRLTSTVRYRRSLKVNCLFVCWIIFLIGLISWESPTQFPSALYFTLRVALRVIRYSTERRGPAIVYCASILKFENFS